jgi:hypothetical protein
VLHLGQDNFMLFCRFSVQMCRNCFYSRRWALGFRCQVSEKDDIAQNQ